MRSLFLCIYPPFSHLFYPLIRHLLLPKRRVFSPFCCDKLIKWNIKCVIFRVRRRGEKDEGTFQYC